MFKESFKLMVTEHYCFSGKFLQSLVTISTDPLKYLVKVISQKFQSDKLITLSP